MGGKSKKANRTKDNARPSSSSHCAELLGSNVPIFIDFSTAKDSFFGSSDEFGCNIDANFQIVLKKMTKKDSVTKLKALQEFTEMCKNSDAEAIKAILPFWPRLYCSLATDVEHRVREAVHCAHAAIVEKVKKHIAPYLKQLAGPWFTSQYDNYPPAASAATMAFEQAFPPGKLNKFISFCQEEILNYIYESLIKHTPQTLCNPKITKPEEMDAKYQRIVIASLQGYNFYVQKVTADQLAEAEESNRKIVSSQKFWDYSKNKVPLIRNSFFNVVISLCQNGKVLLTTEMKRITVAIFNDLDDADPMVMASVWDAALNALVFLDNCWAHVSLDKQVFPKLNAIIKEGGRNAITVFPCLLPLLSKIPDNLIKEKTEFYGKLLQNIRFVLSGSQTVHTSSSDFKTIARTFIECLQYIITQYITDTSLCTVLITEHLISALEKQLAATKSSNSAIFFSETVKLLRTWHSLLASGKDGYADVLNLFWSSLSNSFSAMIDDDSSVTTLGNVLNNQMEFLRTLHNYKRHVYKPKKRLKFEDLDGDDAAAEPDGGDGEEFDADFKDRVLAFAKAMAVLYLKRAVEKEMNVYVPNVAAVVTVFDTKAVLDEFLVVLNEDSFYSFFCNVLLKWLGDPKMKTGDVVSLSFCLLPYVGESEKEAILQTFCQDWSKNELQRDICRSLLVHASDNSVKYWITSKSFSDRLSELVAVYLESEYGDDASRDIITTFFNARDENEEFVIGAETASSIMNLLSDSLQSRNSRKHVRQLTQVLISNVNPDKTKCQKSFEGLVVTLFKLSCYYREDDDLTASCDAALGNIDSARSDFLMKIADSISGIVLGDDDFEPDDVVHRINRFIEITVKNELNDCGNSIVKRAVSVVKHLVREPECVSACRRRLEKCCYVGYESVGEFDSGYVALRGRKTPSSQTEMPQIPEDVTRSDLETLVSDCLGYYYYCDKTKRLKNLDMDVEMVVKFARWNVYVGSLFNLIAAAHPKQYRTLVLLETWNPYVCGDEEKDADVLPIRITKEELENLKSELRTVQEKFTQSEYEERLIMADVCNEVLDFTLSVGLLLSLSSYYSGTKYHHVLNKFVKGLKKLGNELFMNMNTLEHLFFYRLCRSAASESAAWRLVATTLQEFFSRTLVDQTDAETSRVTDVMNNHATDEALLKLSLILKSKHVIDVTEEEWNKLFIYIHKLFETNEFGSLREDNLTVLSLSCRVMIQLTNAFAENHSRSLDDRLCPEACLAWNEVVKGELANQFFHVWKKLAAKYHDKVVPLEVLAAIQNVGEVVMSCRASDSLSGSDCVRLASDYLTFMNSAYPVFQVTSFELLLRLVPELVKLDTEIFCEDFSKITEDMKAGSFKVPSKCEWTCKKLEPTISVNQGIIEALFSDFVVGDCCSVEPFTDSFNYTYSYLLAWTFLLDMCGEAHTSLRSQYGFWLKDQGYSVSLLGSVFKLMPQAVVHGAEAKENCQRYFEKFTAPSVRDPVTGERIEHVACFVYRMLLQRLPNMVREWWSQSENKTSTLVDKVTGLYVSPILIADELKSVQVDRDGDFDNMEIKVHPNAREVIATYTIDDVKMDLVMTLPQNFPLGTIKIESSNVVVGNSSRRNWLFLISKYLIHQNGTIGEALIMWKNNLVKKFEGIEECYICASILQGSTCETPRICCKICKKKFHSHCLYKWFSTSNNSSCPICRNLF